MKNKIIVIISEGGSESSFIKELLKNNYGFKNSELTGKGQEVIEKDNFYIFFSHPICINGNYGNIGGGDTSIINLTTYIKINHLIKQYLSHLLNESDIFYLIQTDVNKKIEKEKFISENIKKCKPGKLYISFSSLMIESWFIAGISSNFIEKHNIKKGNLIKFYKKNIDEYENIKYELDNLLPDYLSGNRNEIGREFGKYIDIEIAKEKSQSFKKFIEILDEIL